jgi:hypothetical protein
MVVSPGMHAFIAVSRAVLCIVPVCLLLSCRETPTGITRIPSPPDSLPANPIVGFWPHPHPTEEMLLGWRDCAGATGILVNSPPPWWDAIHLRFDWTKKMGYTFILYPAYKDHNFELLGPVLRDSLAGPQIDALFVDEPFSQLYDHGVPRSHGLTDEQFLELVVFCNAFGKKLAMAFYQAKPEMSVEQLDHAFTIIKRFDRLRGTDMAHQLIIMPDNYFNCSPTDITNAYANLCAWAEKERVPRTHIMPWIGPSCIILGKQEKDCRPSYTYDAIMQVRALGFGGWFIYPGNGINAEHAAMMLAAHRALGITKSDTCAYDLTY